MGLLRGQQHKMDERCLLRQVRGKIVSPMPHRVSLRKPIPSTDCLPPASPCLPPPPLAVSRFASFQAECEAQPGEGVNVWGYGGEEGRTGRPQNGWAAALPALPPRPYLLFGHLCFSLLPRPPIPSSKPPLPSPPSTSLGAECAYNTFDGNCKWKQDVWLNGNIADTNMTGVLYEADS
jgi:hypothetical protein